jgi:inactive STAND/Effector-associated domain 2
MQLDYEKLTIEQKEDLADALSACPVISDRDRRQTLVDNLPNQIKNTLRISDSERVDAINILRACNDCPEGFQKLLETIKFVGGKDSLALGNLKKCLERLSNNRLIDESELYRELQKLNYTAQEISFRGYVAKHSKFGAFLIYGNEDHGQKFLLNRLVQRNRNEILNGKRIPISFDTVIHTNDIITLWKRLNKELTKNSEAAFVGTDEEKSTLRKSLLELLTMQHVMIIFHHVQKLTKDVIDAWIREFINPLFKEFQDCLNSKLLEFDMFIFMLDYTGETASFELPFIQNDVPDQPMLMRIPEISKLKVEDLSNWILACEKLPKSLASDPENSAKMILNNSAGIPLTALKVICELCDHDWQERESQWLKL